MSHVLTCLLMGRVECIALPGLEMWFNSSDHEPPHFHAERPGEWEVRVFFLRGRADMFETKWSARKGKPTPAQLGRLGRIAERNRLDLLIEWERKVRTSGSGR